MGLFGSMELAQVYESKSERGPSPNDLRICYDASIAVKFLCKYSGIFNSVFEVQCLGISTEWPGDLRGGTETVLKAICSDGTVTYESVLKTCRR